MNKYSDFLSSKIDSDSVQTNYRKILLMLAKHKIAAWLLDLSTWEFTFSDDFFSNTGFSDVGIKYDTYDEFLDFLYSEDLKYYKQVVNNIVSGEKKTVDIQFRCLGTENEMLWVEDIILGIEGEDGNLGGIMGYRRNISGEKTAYAGLANFNLDKVIEVLPHFLIVYGCKGDVLDVAASKYVKIYHDRESLINTNLRDYFDEAIGNKLMSTIKKCLADHELKEVDISIDLNGLLYYFNVRMIPYGRDKVLALMSDVTNNVRQTEVLATAKKNANKTEELKKTFLASMSHELRTPLNSIVGFSNLLSMAHLDEKEREIYVNIIQDNTNLLLQLMQDLLDFSQLETGNLMLNILPVEIVYLLRELEEKYSGKTKKGVKLIIQLPKEEVWARVDEKKVSHILANFLSNSVKNTEHGEIVLSFERFGKWLKFSVSDSGCGIPNDKINVIFEKFEKLDTFSQGLGLGLSISKALADMLGGRIEVTSTLGVGSTFSLYLPYVSINKAEIHAEDMPNRPYGSGEKIILVVKKDKNAFIRLSKMLNDKYVVLLARNGEEAMDTFFRFKPDLVFTELDVLGSMTGLEIIKKIKKQSPETPVVGITDQIMYQDHNDAIHAGCNDVIVKPYTQVRLAEVVTSLL
ncbi:ATP-binding protein [uncultured Bacteroides sp.]|uniref:ATP-binding protein n=1 Tax=uncultured Bacteroides sp. TaxID=162156 RepID=UPI002AAB777E|nr:ATP-binding protein [uncultured Bacteroides sp.]